MPRYSSFSLPIPGTVGTRVGGNSDGALVGSLTVTDADDVTYEDDSGGTFVDETTDAADAGTGDVTVTEPFDSSDALFVGYAKRFCAIEINMTTAGAGDAVEAETLWEYSTGTDTWSSLEAAGIELTDSSAALTTGTGTYIVSFIPPSDWAKTPVDGGTSMYFVRMRGTANDVYNTTTPTMATVKVLPLNAGDGLSAPASGYVDSIESHAMTASASNDDTELLIINTTQGTACQYTWTGADVIDSDTSVTELAGGAFRIRRGDKLALYCMQEDGTTEFAAGSIQLNLK